MKLRHFSLLTLFAGILFLLIGIVSPCIVLYNYTSQHGAIGIIGGADTPTISFIVFGLMGGWPFVVILFGIALIISALFCLIFFKTVKNNCEIKTTVFSLGLSAVGALGLLCAYLWLFIVSSGNMSTYPIVYPVSILLGIICFFIFIVLIAIYLILRKNNWSIKGFCIDILTSIIYLPAFFYAFAFLYNLS